MLIDLQLNPATTPWPLLRDGVLAAEQAGFGAFWMVDHLAGRSMGGNTMVECFTTLGALAAVTTSIPLGTLVANVHNREPGVLAVAVATLDHIGGRRILLGLGAGTSPTSPYAAEQLAVGAPIAVRLADRHAAVERTLDLLDEMWGPAHPEHFDTFPRPSHRPLVLLGANSVALARIAGSRTDGVNVRWTDPNASALLDAADQAARAGRAVLRTTWAPWDEALCDPDHPERRRMTEVGIDRLILTAHHGVDPEEVSRVGQVIRAAA
ncbi:MAG: LLM class flavin-dependent oxidoreductase [Actinomycetota bacterium]|nr:LLM class flavin-dependent oxidoreductase [Actinomycetota bacterium]